MKRFSTIIIICLFVPLILLAQEPTKTSNSTFTKYLRQQKHLINQNNIPKSADSLFRRSIKSGNISTQIVAMWSKSEYYYKHFETDSAKLWLNEIRAYTKTNQELNDCFYDIWIRFVSHHIKQGQLSIAQTEGEKLIKAATYDNNKLAIIKINIQLAHVYSLRNMHKESIALYQKAAEVVKNNNFPFFSTANIYLQICDEFQALKMYDKALEILDKALEGNTSSRRLWRIKSTQANIYAKLEKFDEAEQIFQELETSKEFDIPILMRQQFHVDYYLNSQQPKKAKRAILELLESYEELNIKEAFYYDLYYSMSWVNAAMHEDKLAYENLCKYLDLYKQKIAISNSAEVLELTSALTSAQVNRDKSELILEEQDKSLQKNKIVNILLLTVLAFGVIFITIYSRMAIKLRRSEKDLRQAKERAEESNIMKTKFIQSITHEINTPLNSIVGFSQMALSPQVNAQDRSSYMDIVKENSSHLQKLIENALFISDLESSDNAVEFEATNVKDCCLRSISRISDYCKPGAIIKFNPCKENLMINSSPRYLTQALFELMHNASKFTENGTIELQYTLCDNNKYIEFTITDTGCGIPKETQECIFDRFTKLDSFQVGMGLGLAICKLIAEKLNGSIKLDTTYTNGARFVLRFPTNQLTQ